MKILSAIHVNEITLYCIIITTIVKLSYVDVKYATVTLLTIVIVPIKMTYQMPLLSM
jgi:hypothetical protein